MKEMLVGFMVWGYVLLLWDCGKRASTSWPENMVKKKLEINTLTSWWLGSQEKWGKPGAQGPLEGYGLY